MSVHSTGSNSDGQLANRSDLDSAHFSPCQGLPNSRALLDLAFGASHTLALVCAPTESRSAPREVYVSGSNARGQLGTSFAPEEPLTVFRKLGLAAYALDEDEWEPVQVAAAWESSFVVLRDMTGDGEDDVVFVLGADDWAERAGMASGALISFAHLNPFPKPHSSRMKVVSLQAGPRHVVAILEWTGVMESGQAVARMVVGWGAGRHGQLGLGVSERKLEKPTILRLPEGSKGTNVVDLSVGREHTLLLMGGAGAGGDGQKLYTAREIVLLGNNKHQQLGTSTSDSHAVHQLPLAGAQAEEDPLVPPLYQASCGWSASYVLSIGPLGGSLAGFGSNARSQLGLPSSSCTSSAVARRIDLPPVAEGESRRVVRMAVGSEHVLLLCRTGKGDEVWAWGWNEHGNLGTGDQADAEQPVQVWPAKDSNEPRSRVAGIWAGNATSWIATSPVHE